MKETKEQLALEIRQELGNPLETELPMAYIEESIESALLEYSRYKPREVWRPFTVSPNTPGYEVEEDVLRVIDVILEPTRMGTFEYDTESQMYFWDTIFSDSSIVNNPSLLTVYAQRAKMFEARFGTDWEYMDGYIVFLPTPTYTRKAMYQASVVQTLKGIPQNMKNVFKMWAVAQCKEEMGNRRNKKIAEVPTNSGTIRFDTGARFMEEAEKLKEDFRERLGGNGSAFVIG